MPRSQWSTPFLVPKLWKLCCSEWHVPIDQNIHSTFAWLYYFGVDNITLFSFIGVFILRLTFNKFCYQPQTLASYKTMRVFQWFSLLFVEVSLLDMVQVYFFQITEKCMSEEVKATNVTRSYTLVKIFLNFSFTSISPQNFYQQGICCNWTSGELLGNKQLRAWCIKCAGIHFLCSIPWL